MSTTKKPRLENGSSTNSANNANPQYENSHTWENVESHIWETEGDEAMQFDEYGNPIAGISTAAQLAEAIRRRRRVLSKRDYGQSSRRIIRDMIRYLYLIIDTSSSMREKDMTLTIVAGGTAGNAGGGGASKTRLDVVLRHALRFVNEYYDQNPLSHLGIILLKDGQAEMLTQLSGSPRVHTNALEILIQSESGTGPATGGEMSLQNGLEVAGRSLGHMPNYGSREVVLLVGALSTSDPGDVLCETLPRLKQAKIRVSCVALVAEMHVCKRITEVTGGIMGVSMDGGHLKDLIMSSVVPPPAIVSDEDEDQQAEKDGNKYCEFVQMGFPTRETSDVPSLIHVTRDKKVNYLLSIPCLRKMIHFISYIIFSYFPSKMFGLTGYICPRCRAKVSDLPTDCPVCGLKLVLAPHLARSFHHLFPVPPFVEVPDTICVKELYEDLNKPESTASNTDLPSVVSSTVPLTIKKDKKANNVVDGTLVINSTYCDRCCYGCGKIIPTQEELEEKQKNHAASMGKGSSSKSPSQQQSSTTKVAIQEPCLRFQCPDCLNIFCADCDAYLHETLHNCPGCLCKD